MSEWIKAQLPTLSEDQLRIIATDAAKRIRRHLVGGYHQPEYIQRQQSIVDAVLEEKRNRGINTD